MDRRLGIRAALMRPCFGVAVAALAVVLLSGCGEVGSAGRATWGWGWLLVDDPDLSWSARWGLVSMELVTWAWFFVLGAVLASFLNVVAWRWPRGQSISRPRSHCPHCATPLAWYDNVPIVGWLRLRGRCRHCGGAISPRYVLVEAALGALFVALLLVETLSGGRNLPVRAPNHYGGVVWVIWYTRWDLLRLFAYHAALISLLGTVVLVKLQGQRIPIKLAALLLGLGVVPPLVWPDLHPVPFAGPGLYETYDRTYGPVAIPPRRPDWLGSRPVAWGAADVLSGLACGAGLGLAMEMLARRCGRNSARQGATALAVAAVGTYLGWQAALSMAALSAVGRLLLSAVGRLWPRCRQVPDVAIDFVALLVQLAAWRWLAGWAWWPGPTAGAVLSISFAAGICVLTAVAALLSVDQDTGTAAAQRPEPPVPGPPADSSAAPHLA